MIKVKEIKKEIIAIDSNGIRHVTEEGNGRKYCSELKINLDWSPMTSPEGIVLNGGVYFSCRECDATGVIATSDFTRDIKHKCGIQPYQPIGVEFYSCAEHEGQNEDE